jgi:hypothetical protein
MATRPERVTRACPGTNRGARRGGCRQHAMEVTISTADVGSGTATQVAETRPMTCSSRSWSWPRPPRAREAVLRVAGLAVRRRPHRQRGLPGPGVHAARLAGVDHLRHPGRGRGTGVDRPARLAVDDIEAAREQLLARRRGVPGVRRRRWWPPRRLPRRHRRAHPGDGSGGALLRLVRLIQRPGRQRLAAAGDHRTTPGRT